MLNAVFPLWLSFTQEDIDAVKSIFLSNKVNYWMRQEYRELEKNGTEKRSSYEEPYSVDQLEKFYVFLIGLAVLAALGCELSTLWGVLPVWGIIGAVASGAVIGMLSSRILALEKCRTGPIKLLYVSLRCLLRRLRLDYW